MKFSHLVGAALLGAAVTPAFSACTGTPLNLTQLSTLLNNQLVCGRPGAAYPGNSADRWQEEHVAGGALFDFKMGSGHAVDPRKEVGTWVVSATAVRTQPAAVKYVYPPTTAFSWVVYGPTTNNPGVSVYSFCTAGTTPVEHARAYVKAINAAAGCSGAYPP